MTFNEGQILFELLKKDVKITKLECEIEALKQQKENLSLAATAANMQIEQLRAKYEPTPETEKTNEFLSEAFGDPPVRESIQEVHEFHDKGSGQETS